MRQGNGDAGFAVHANGTVADAIAAVLKREGVDMTSPGSAGRSR